MTAIDDLLARAEVLAKTPGFTECLHCGGSRGDPDDRGWQYHGITEPGSVGPCPVCGGSGSEALGLAYTLVPALAQALRDERALADRLADALQNDSAGLAALAAYRAARGEP